jgi:hypothetical protein
MNPPFNAPEQIHPEEMHAFATYVADLYQQQSVKKWNDRDEWSDIVRSALVAITHDAVLTHKSVGLLVAEGWSSSAAPLVRTLLDLTISMLAILNSENPRLAAFRYLHAGYRNFERDQKYSKRNRDGMRMFLRARIEALDAADRPAAFKYLRAKERPYWFADEWPRPSDIIEAFGSEHLQWAYRQYSAAAHGGFFGLRMFRDRPFDSDIRPRLPVGRNAATVSLQSSRLLIELIEARDYWENVGFRQSICPNIRELFSRVVIPADIPDNDE